MYFKLDNYKSKCVELLSCPWDYDASTMPHNLPKEQFKEWYNRKDSKGCLISMTACDDVNGAYGDRVNGTTATPRVTYGLMADYDGLTIPDDSLVDANGTKLPQGVLAKNILSRINLTESFRPSWASVSQSGKLHLFWDFEEPVYHGNIAQASAFLRTAMDHLGAAHIGYGYDKRASTSPTQYFDIGKMWIGLDGTAIDKESLRFWQYEAAMETADSRLRSGSQNLPLDKVYELLKNKYDDCPTLELGKRCRRFWDPDADNATGCVVVSDGFKVFTPHDNGFKRFTELLSKQQVDGLVGSLKPDLSSYFYVAGNTSTRYFETVVLPDGRKTFQYIKDSTLRTVLTARGLESRQRKGESISEVDEALLAIRNTNRVMRVIPLLFERPGLTRAAVDGCVLPVLNVSTVLPVTPDPEDFNGQCIWENAELAERCPFIYNLLTFLFCETRAEWDEYKATGHTYNGSTNRQLMTFISWLAHYYKSAVSGDHSFGQAMFLCGGPNTGKSFLIRHILPALFGGVAQDGSQMIFGTTKTFVRAEAENPIIMLDDNIPADDKGSRSRAASAIKRFVASDTITYEPKGIDATTIPFRGRIVVACNSDPKSLTLLPPVEKGSTDDKFIMLKVGNFPAPDGVFSAKEDNIHALKIEAPRFARFLLGFQTPEDILDRRFGVKSYQHPELMAATLDLGWAGTMLDLLLRFYLQRYLPCLVDPEAKHKILSTSEGRAKLVDSLAESVANASPDVVSSGSLFRKIMMTFRDNDADSLRGLNRSLVEYSLTEISSSEKYSSTINKISVSGRQYWKIDPSFVLDYFGSKEGLLHAIEENV